MRFRAPPTPFPSTIKYTHSPPVLSTVVQWRHRKLLLLALYHPSRGGLQSHVTQHVPPTLNVPPLCVQGLAFASAPDVLRVSVPHCTVLDVRLGEDHLKPRVNCLHRLRHVCMMSTMHVLKAQICRHHLLSQKLHGSCYSHDHGHAVVVVRVSWDPAPGRATWHP